MEAKVIEIKRDFVEITNPRNGGRERIWRGAAGYYVSSDWGRGYGNRVPISRHLLVVQLTYQGAPAWLLDMI